MIKAHHAVRKQRQQQAALLYVHWDQEVSAYFDIDFLSCHLSQQNKASAAKMCGRKQVYK